MSDMRAAAWMLAWDRLKSATEIQEKFPNGNVDETVARLHRAAEIYAQLASVSDEVGYDAYQGIGERKRLRRAERKMMDEFFAANSGEKP